jgi:hypothetical protein
MHIPSSPGTENVLHIERETLAAPEAAVPTLLKLHGLGDDESLGRFKSRALARLETVRKTV